MIDFSLGFLTCAVVTLVVVFTGSYFSRRRELDFDRRYRVIRGGRQ